MGKATNTKDYSKIDYASKFPHGYPKNEDIIKTYIKEDKSMRWVGSDNVPFPFATEPERISYWKIVLVDWTVTPISQNTILSINARRASHLVDTLTGQIKSPYENCFWEITRYWVSTTVFSNLQFDTVYDMYQFVFDNSGSVSGGIYQYDFSAECYDRVDANIPSIAKIHWQNMFYSMLKGRKQYKKTMSVLDNSVERWDYNQWIEDVIRTVTPYTTYNRVGWDNWNNMIRVPWNYRKMYWLLRWDATVDNFSWWARYTTNWTSIIDNSSWPTWEYSVDHNNSYYCWIDMMWSIYTFYEKKSMYKYFSDLQFSSTVICYRLENGWNYSVFVKPVWIDMLTIPYFDTSKYDLYWYMHGRNRYNQLKKIDTANIIQGWPYQDAFRIPLTARTPVKYRAQSIKWYWETMSMRLVLKDKITWKISWLSKPRIVWRSGRDKPLVADVRY